MYFPPHLTINKLFFIKLHKDWPINNFFFKYKFIVKIQQCFKRINIQKYILCFLDICAFNKNSDNFLLHIF